MSKQITIPDSYDYSSVVGDYDLKSMLDYAVDRVPFDRPTKAELHASIMGANEELT